jgi:hypothetical protein
MQIKLTTLSRSPVGRKYGVQIQKGWLQSLCCGELYGMASHYISKKGDRNNGRTRKRQGLYCAQCLVLIGKEFLVLKCVPSALSSLAAETGGWSVSSSEGNG